ncbi:tetratricopeptide repeat protein [Halomonas dongshanensis]|uniref:Tetratricopeptide repeat protein n=1 Tax=Halomonas dongshanensis TaxID=2890835 RepID=A0ABT2EGX7_9GAMM|nr:tetratricopeptide repeat protein [Halomonas dongshanensis]MCS2610785.1 tetratricopeptide repeat protein [Halomonas dongshanensis]
MKYTVTFALLGATLLLSGCATSGGSSLGSNNECRPLEPEQQLAVQLASDMADQGRMHAALAHLERLPETLPEVRLQKAMIMRQLGDPAAVELYRSLLKSCVAAEAHHGLGQIAAMQGNLDEALNQMQTAASLYPSSYTIRNDLGFVHLQRRELDKARFEFLTALELSQDDPLPLENMITLLIYQGQWQEASALLREGRATPALYQRGEERARQLQQEDQQRQ